MDPLPTMSSAEAEVLDFSVTSAGPSSLGLFLHVPLPSHLLMHHFIPVAHNMFLKTEEPHNGDSMTVTLSW